MAAVVEAEERITSVHIEGLALLKIVKHCHESLPQMVTGSLLGLSVKKGVLEITHAFPVPDSKDSDGGDGFHDEMMRMLREVNVDNNEVGWYQSMYLGIYSTPSLVENQLSYQTDIGPNAVVLLYDPMQTQQGNLVLKCRRLTDDYLKLSSSNKNEFMDPKTIFQDIPVTLSNPNLARVFLADVVRPTSSINFDRLDLSTNPYLEKHLEFLCSWVDDLANEQHKFQYYTRNLGGTDGRRGQRRGKKDDSSHANTVREGWASSDAPKRMESLLITNQIRTYCDQVDKFAGGGFGKLFLAGGLHKEERSTTK